jgi:flagellar export protein FliJ
MSSGKALPRLLRLRQLEEEQARLELEAQLMARNMALERQQRIVERQDSERREFEEAVQHARTADRTGAVMELGLILDQRLWAEKSLAAAESAVDRSRATFLQKRIGRRQVESLVEEQALLAREEANRRDQQQLDDWYGRRRSGKTGGTCGE